MTIDGKIGDEKLKYNREAANRYEFLTGKEILPRDQKRVIEQACISCFRKSF